MLYKSADERQRGADGLGGSARTCERLLMGSWTRLLNVARSAICPAFAAEGKASEMIHGGNILISAASQGGNDLEMMRLRFILLLILQ